MSYFTLKIIDSRKQLVVENVSSFVGEDGSGSFGILPDHTRMMTVLTFGLASFRRGEGDWEYVAGPGAVLYFDANVLNLVSRHYLIDTEYERIAKRLVEELVAEEEQVREVRQSLKSMEEALLKRMWELRRQGGSLL